MDLLYYAALTAAVLGVVAFVGWFNWLWVRDRLDAGRTRLDEQLRQGMSSPHVGKLARVREAVGPDRLRVELDGRVWPATLPPFTPTPPNGESVRVINVVSEVLIVQPVRTGAPPEPSDPA